MESLCKSFPKSLEMTDVKPLNEPKKQSKVKGKKKIFITNIVSVSKCDRLLPLRFLALGLYGKFGHAFPAVVSRQRNTRTSFEMFHDGAVINCAARSKAQSLLALALYESAISSIFRQVLPVGYHKITNIVLACRVGHKINMDKLNTFYGSFGSWYRPTVFPGFALKQPDLGVSFIVFKGGNVNITGLKRLSQIPIVYERIQKLVVRCRYLPGEDDEEEDAEDDEDDDAEEESLAAVWPLSPLMMEQMMMTMNAIKEEKI